jgi:hypothetical protein
LSRYNLELKGWRRQSIWGWDPVRECYYAQLTPDRSNREADRQGPEILLGPPHGPAIPDLRGLAEAIAFATGVAVAHARKAMNKSMGEGGPIRGPRE